MCGTCFGYSVYISLQKCQHKTAAPVEEYYEAGDVVEHNGLEICVANLYFGNMNDIVDKKNMPEKMRSDNDGLVIVFDVTNKKRRMSIWQLILYPM